MREKTRGVRAPGWPRFKRPPSHRDRRIDLRCHPSLYRAHDELLGGDLSLQLLEASVNEVVPLDDQLEVSLQLDQSVPRPFEISLVRRGLQVGRRDQGAGQQTRSQKNARKKAPALPTRHLPAPSR